MVRPVEVRGRPIGGGKLPAICVPLIGRSSEAILAELAAILGKKPDLIEWRADYFSGLADSHAVIDLARRIRRSARKMPILFTLRSFEEGGEPSQLTENDGLLLYEAVCESRCVDLVDFELSKREDHVRRVRDVSRKHDIQMIMSYHNFRETPALDNLILKFAQAQDLGADVGKVAVMPNDVEDVLTLLSATLQCSRRLSIPLISMSMGGSGLLTRMFGWMFGSAVTFAIAQGSSAPGQVPIEDLSAVLSMTRKALAGSSKPPSS
ncbi:MAG TPA: type I 3-dehydroquinate dehydratase [Hyphomicrobiaceae bacterium]|nr:type I 3-dehydroquinate dehydratase [Hyphomicrobiaceae bacterium]